MKGGIVWSLGLMALLLTSTIAAVMPIQKSFAAVTIETSSDTFYGPSLVRVLITDTAKTEADDTINVDVEVVGKSSITVTAASIGTSGQFELYIAAHTTALPANPTQVADADGDDDALATNEFTLVRIFDTGMGNDNQGNVASIDVALEEGDDIEITYGGQTKTITYEPTDASFSLDRTIAGDGNQIILSIMDQDANLDPTSVDSFAADVSIVDVSTGFAIDFTNVMFEETGQNTGDFEANVMVNEPFDAMDDNAELRATGDNPIDFPNSASFTLTDHDVYHSAVATVAGTPPFTVPEPTLRTVSETVQLRNFDGEIVFDKSVTIGNGFDITIIDPDRNIDTTTEDSFMIALFAGDPDMVEFEETGDNTGEFVPALANNRIPIVIDDTVTGFDFDGSNFRVEPAFIADDGDITLEYNDPNSDPSGADVFSRTISIEHEAGDISTETPSVLLTGTAIIVIDDMDLNTDNTIVDSHTVSFAVNADGEAVGDILDGLARLTISVVGKEINSLVPSTLVLTEVDADGNPAVDSGMFRAEFDIDSLDMVAGNELESGDKISVEYEDFSEDPSITRSVDIRIAEVTVDVMLDRNSYPPSHAIRMAFGADTDGVAVARNVVLHVTIQDDSANESPTSEETLNLAAMPNNFRLELLGPNNRIFTVLGDNTAFEDEDGDGMMDAGEPNVNMLRIDPNNPVDMNNNPNYAVDNTPIDTSATETGPNTGIFETEINLPAAIDTDMDNAADLVVDEDFQIRIVYESAGEEASTTASIASTTASLSTNANVYNIGNTIILTINEPDWNTDSEVEDEISADLDALFVDARAEGTLQDVLRGGMTLDPTNIRETGPNTGIFEIKIENINEDFVERGSSITFEYEDRTTSGGGGKVTVEHTVNVILGEPEIIFDKDVYTPFEEVCVSIVDPSANIDPDVKDTIGNGGSSVIITVSGVDEEETLVFEETEVDSGIFMWQGDECIQLDANLWPDNTNPNDGRLPAARDKAIRVEYETAGGDITLTRSALIVFNDGSISFDKTSYNIGDTAVITVIDPDLNTRPDVPDSVDVSVWSTTDRAGIEVTLRETGDKTGVFTGEVLLSRSTSSGNRLQVSDGDTITARYTDRTLPDPADYDPDRNALESLDVARLDATATIGISQLTTERAPASEPEFVDELGNPIEEIMVGTQVLISSQVTNNQTISQDFVQIVKVTDEDGNVVMLAFTQGTLNPNEVRSNAFSWTPEESGTYTVEVFVWESFANPIPLSPKISVSVEVV